MIWPTCRSWELGRGNARTFHPAIYAHEKNCSNGSAGAAFDHGTARVVMPTWCTISVIVNRPLPARGPKSRTQGCTSSVPSSDSPGSLRLRSLKVNVKWENVGLAGTVLYTGVDTGIVSTGLLEHADAWSLIQATKRRSPTAVFSFCWKNKVQSRRKPSRRHRVLRCLRYEPSRLGLRCHNWLVAQKKQFSCN